MRPFPSTHVTTSRSSWGNPRDCQLSPDVILLSQPSRVFPFASPTVSIDFSQRTPPSPQDLKNPYICAFVPFETGAYLFWVPRPWRLQPMCISHMRYRGTGPRLFLDLGCGRSLPHSACMGGCCGVGFPLGLPCDRLNRLNAITGNNHIDRRTGDADAVVPTSYDRCPVL